MVTDPTSKYLIDKIITFLTTERNERNVWHPSREIGIQSGERWVAAQIKREFVAQHRPVRVRPAREEREDASPRDFDSAGEILSNFR